MPPTEASTGPAKVPAKDMKGAAAEAAQAGPAAEAKDCLLYTSDAADE